MTRINKNKWISVHLYHDEPLETFLISQVRPIINKVIQKKIAKQFFFIRYWDGGLHIRLRFKCKDLTLKNKLRNIIYIHFLKYYKNSRVISLSKPIKFIPYEPEYERYGGKKKLKIAEKQFQASSEAILDILQDIIPWNYEKALGHAFLLHLCFSFALGMTKKEMVGFYSLLFKDMYLSFNYDNISNNNSAERKISRKSLKDIEIYAKSIKPKLLPFCKEIFFTLENHTEFHETWINKWIIDISKIRDELNGATFKLNPFFNKILSTDKNTVSHKNLWIILSSYIHMTNNRIGISNYDEVRLCYLLSECLKSI